MTTAAVRVTLVPTYHRLSLLLMRRQDNRTNNKIVRDDHLRVSRAKTNIFFFLIISMQCAYDNSKSKKIRVYLSCKSFD